MKKIIFRKLYEDLKHVEIIPYKDSIWFIDREQEYWYFEYKKSELLYWKWDFFIEFFELFSMKRNEFEPYLCEWVEEVLNTKVETFHTVASISNCEVEEVLNTKVETLFGLLLFKSLLVGKASNFKVKLAPLSYQTFQHTVEEVLNYKVSRSDYSPFNRKFTVEEVLKD